MDLDAWDRAYCGHGLSERDYADTRPGAIPSASPGGAETPTLIVSPRFPGRAASGQVHIGREAREARHTPFLRLARAL